MKVVDSDGWCPRRFPRVPSTADLDETLAAILSLVPRGRVTTPGALATGLGDTGAARFVGERLSVLRRREVDGVFRVVLSTGEGGASTSGVIWLEPSSGVFDSMWTEHEISGLDGKKFDDSLLIDLDGDGDLDVINTEEDFGSGSTGLGVIWYENPSR